MTDMYILIDGENIDATLGVNILKRTPRGEERPRWDRVLFYNVDGQSEQSEGDELQAETPQNLSAPDRKGLFFLNATYRTADSFVQALLAIGWTPIQLQSTDEGRKLVDEGIQRTLEAIVESKPGVPVVVGTHDVDYLPQLEALLDAGHDVSVMCFREFLALPIAELESRGLHIIDLEYDVHAFNIMLNRVHPIDIDDFDPYDFL